MKQPLLLEDQVAIVTGAGQGIGKAIAAGLAAQGASVCVADIDRERGREAADEIIATGAEVAVRAVDVADWASVSAMVESCRARWGRIDILVNNAAVATTELVVDLSEDGWRRVVDVNLTGAFLCCKAVLPQMLAQQRGKIVNVASVAGKRISFNASASYTAAKAGLLGFTRHLAYEVAAEGINVNAICPGPTLTPLLEGLASSESLRARERTVPRGRLASPEDHVNAVLFLVSDLAEMICGVAIDVDGGALLGWDDIDSYRKRRRRN